MAKFSGKQQHFAFDVPSDGARTQASGQKLTNPGSAAEGVEVPADSETSAEPLQGRTVYVVDSHSLIFQVFHVMPEMTSPTGEPTGAIHGFIRDMLDLLEKRKPDYLICAFDPPGDTFRHELYDQYKAGREEMPDDLRPQIANIRRTLEAIGIPILEQVGYEADDVLATLARQVERLGGRCVLVTSDKDCRQLITNQVTMLNVRKGQVLDAEGLWKDWGVRPDQVVDFQALVGDKVDNVPGVPLIGPKNAAELLQKYGNLDEILAHAHEVAGAKRRENLLAHRENVLLSRKLVRLDDSVPLEIDWRAAQTSRFRPAAAQPLFQEFGFRQLAERARNMPQPKAPAPDAAAPVDAAPWGADYRVIATESEFQELVKELARQEQVSIDTETTHVNPRFAEVVGYSLCWKEGEAFYLPVRAPEGEPRLDPATTLDALREALESDRVRKIGQNLKYDLVVLRGAGVAVQGLAFDTMIADYLLEAGEQSHSLDDLAQRYLGHKTIKITELIGVGKHQKQMDEVPLAQIGPYAAEDADVPVRLTSVLKSRLSEEGLEALFRDVEMPLIDVLVEMEFNGVRIDVELLARLSEEYGKRMERAEEEIYAIAGKKFNIGSPKQLAEVLFTDLKLPVVRRTKTGASTDASVLEELASKHALPAKILEYRQYAKLKSTYIDALPQLVHPTTGRVHSSFNQVVAATGRLSSNEPNLQNIPIRTQEGREIRAAFIPGESGWSLVTADYSQIELRVMAHYSQDKTLLEAFAHDQDIHARVASEVYGVPLDQVTSPMRRSAKTINFGVIYGQSPFGLAKSLGISQDEAAAFIDSYFARYPGVRAFIDQTLDACRETGDVRTLLGRRRRVTGVRDPQRRAEKRQMTLPERTAFNTVIQGSAADIIKLAMIAVYRRLRQEKLRSRMLLQIHDELVFEAPEEELDRLATLVSEEMSGVGGLSVPLKVDVKTGPNWAACEVWI